MTGRGQGGTESRWLKIPTWATWKGGRRWRGQGGWLERQVRSLALGVRDLTGRSTPGGNVQQQLCAAGPSSRAQGPEAGVVARGSSAEVTAQPTGDREEEPAGGPQGEEQKRIHEDGDGGREKAPKAQSPPSQKGRCGQESKL